MKTLIIEDEQPAARRLRQLITDAEPKAEIIDVIDSVEHAVKWLHSFPAPDLIFMDIQLADGMSFDIFSQVEVKSPVIFTTAFDQYTLKAFKVNSVDYLLKPVEPAELKQALEKFKRLHQTIAKPDFSWMESVLQNISGNKFKERFFVKKGSQFSYVSVADVAYFLAEDKHVTLITKDNQKFLMEQNLEKIHEQLNPKDFFRISRSMVVHLPSVKKIHNHFNGRLRLELHPPVEEAFVSRERVNDFKEWLDR